MHPVDWTILIVFTAWIVYDGLKRTKDSHELEGYFLAKRSIPWWAAGISVMATQLSAITLVGTTMVGCPIATNTPPTTTTAASNAVASERLPERGGRYRVLMMSRVSELTENLPLAPAFQSEEMALPNLRRMRLKKRP